MTFTSQWLEIVKDFDRGYGGKPEMFERNMPDPPSGALGAYGLKCWAEKRQLHIDYVDNCWLRVEVTADQLAGFLRDVYGADNGFVLTLTGRLAPRETYAIVAEEF